MKSITVVEGTLADTRKLRTSVLGWQQPTVQVDRNRRSRHFVALTESGVVVGCGSCGPSDIPDPIFSHESAMRFWGVAILAPFQGRGLGTAILSELLTHGGRLKADIAWANARESALPFYLARGFREVGDRFTDALSGLTDSRILKRLSTDGGSFSTSDGNHHSTMD